MLKPKQSTYSLKRKHLILFALLSPPQKKTFPNAFFFVSGIPTYPFAHTENNGFLCRCPLPSARCEEEFGGAPTPAGLALRHLPLPAERLFHVLTVTGAGMLEVTSNACSLSTNGFKKRSLVERRATRPRAWSVCPQMRVCRARDSAGCVVRQPPWWGEEGPPERCVGAPTPGTRGRDPVWKSGHRGVNAVKLRERGSSRTETWP